MEDQPAPPRTRGVSTALITLLLYATFAQLDFAQTQDTQKVDLQQLQTKLEQMEKQMLELKQQINSMQQQPQQKPTPAPTKSAEAVAEVVSQEASAHTPVEQVGNPPLPAEHGTTLDLYGFVMLDSGYDFKTNNPNWFDVVRPTKLNASPGEFGPDGKVYFGVRQTRFGVKTSTGAHSLMKTSTTAVQTFMSPLRGLGGVSTYGKNDYYHAPTWKHTTGSEFDVTNVSKLPRVDIIFACADMSPDLIDAAVANGAKGMVIAGVGNGNMNKASLEAAERAAKKGGVIVRSSRVATGTVGRNVEVNDDEMSFVASDELNPQKSRILLILALLKPRSTAEIQQLFQTY